MELLQYQSSGDPSHFFRPAVRHDHLVCSNEHFSLLRDAGVANNLASSSATVVLSIVAEDCDDDVIILENSPGTNNGETAVERLYGPAVIVPRHRKKLPNPYVFLGSRTKQKSGRSAPNKKIGKSRTLVKSDSHDRRLGPVQQHNVITRHTEQSEVPAVEIPVICLEDFYPDADFVVADTDGPRKDPAEEKKGLSSSAGDNRDVLGTSCRAPIVIEDARRCVSPSTNSALTNDKSPKEKSGADERNAEEHSSDDEVVFLAKVEFSSQKKSAQSLEEKKETAQAHLVESSKRTVGSNGERKHSTPEKSKENVSAETFGELPFETKKGALDAPKRVIKDVSKRGILREKNLEEHQETHHKESIKENCAETKTVNARDVDTEDTHRQRDKAEEMDIDFSDQTATADFLTLTVQSGACEEQTEDRLRSLGFDMCSSGYNSDKGCDSDPGLLFDDLEFDSRMETHELPDLVINEVAVNGISHGVESCEDTVPLLCVHQEHSKSDHEDGTMAEEQTNNTVDRKEPTEQISVAENERVDTREHRDSEPKEDSQLSTGESLERAAGIEERSHERAAGVWTFHFAHEFPVVPAGDSVVETECKVCLVRLRDQDMRRHFRECHPPEAACEDIVQCDSCGLIFENERVMKMHQKNYFHERGGKAFEAFVGFKVMDVVLTCENCHSTFESEGDLWSHQFNAFCDYCNMRVTCQRRMKQHLTLECEIFKQMFACKFCSKAWWSGVTLYRHLGNSRCKFRKQLEQLKAASDMLQKTTAAFTCSVCSFALPSRDSLRKHRESQSYSDDGCSRVFRCRTQYLVHIAGDFEYDCKCPRCSDTFSSFRLLLSHSSSCGKSIRLTSASALKESRKAADSDVPKRQRMRGHITVGNLKSLRSATVDSTRLFALTLRRMFPDAYGGHFLGYLVEAIENALNGVARGIIDEKQLFVPRKRKKKIRKYY